ncbi:hypothetical protein [Klebsiella quasipneumoniae]|uniref:hypothetical protein n=1 Tax=Klebsiella quasipneumoniae TaxID=1463165 RepID=UPI00388F4766
MNNKEIMRPWSHNLMKNWRVLNAEAEARKRRAEQKRINELKNNQLEQERLLGWLAFHSAWEHAPAENGSWPYAVKKAFVTYSALAIFVA